MKRTRDALPFRSRITACVLVGGMLCGVAAVADDDLLPPLLDETTASVTQEQGVGEALPPAPSPPPSIQATPAPPPDAHVPEPAPQVETVTPLPTLAPAAPTVPEPPAPPKTGGLTPGGATSSLGVTSTTDMAGPLTEARHGIDCLRDGPCIVSSTGQPLRVMPRALSALYAAPEAGATPVGNDLEAFMPIYVFGIRDLDLSDPAAPKGYYHVGANPTNPQGWIKATDAMEWRQSLMLEFTHPGQGEDRREPALFFDRLKALKTIADAPDRAAATAALRAKIAADGSVNGVIAREPRAFTDISEDPYIYPIVEWKRDVNTIERRRYLRVLTATPGERNPDAAVALREGKVISVAPGAASLAELDVDIVFLLDMTGSMQPYIDAVKQAMEIAADTFRSEFAGARQVRFGLVGYRDDPVRTPTLQFRTRNFTQQGLVDVDGLRTLLENDGQRLAAVVGSDEWAEAVLPGLETAIETTPWTSASSMRVIILLGDASGHNPGETGYSSQIDYQSLRIQANDDNIYLVGAYIQNKRAEADWRRAVEQFDVITRNPGATTPSYGNVPAQTASMIAAILMQFAQDSRMQAEQALAEQNGEAAPPAPAPQPQGTSGDEAQRIAGKWGEALKLGVVDYLGDAQKAPADFTGWVLDSDLADPNRAAVTVRVLVTRAELDNTLRRLRVLLEALEDDKISQTKFFALLQDVSASAGLDVDLSSGETLEESEFLPKWIAALPYRSEVLSMSSRDFEEMSAGDRNALFRRIKSKAGLYDKIMGDTDKWFLLDPRTDDLFAVYPLDLEALP